ncbi:MAG: ClpXP protease specificity-enhancing factor [Gammaproteobacteria bacterium]|jgi:stringent starvation protein B|nr:ClpXP protease specificity-enhancing factor [Gammaproteobacteria bacterium]|tara:strand:- start:9237 stop:9623 length:387 start_codon:yes stop_codon:yes gene_type:complete
MAMSSSVPYLLRATNEWILDNKYTPYLIVDATVSGTVVPADYVKDDQIVLNISTGVIRDLVMNNDYVMFNGRFDGIAKEIVVPIEAVLGIVAKENGEGMWFSKEDGAPEPEPPKTTRKKVTPSLKVVK